MLYLIGLGLNLKSLSLDAFETVKKCNSVYLENYTINFPYKIKELEKVIGKEIKTAERKDIENFGDKILDEAEKNNVALLVYGDPLSATTHSDLLIRAKKRKISVRIFHNATILTAIAKTGLQLYKFGKTGSIPKWEKNYKPESFYDLWIENENIKAHTLLLIDISMPVKDALNQLLEISKKRKDRKLDNKDVLICSNLGTDKEKILFGSVKDLIGENFDIPACIIIPSELHFIEKEFLNLLKK